MARDAYRQCAVSPASSQFSHIAVRNPSSGEAAIFRMLALPFGSIKSVHSFLRVTHGIWFILEAHLDSRHLSHIVNTVFRLLGWAVAESGPKAADFAAAAQALGVRVDVSEMHRGSVWVDNTESGKSVLSSCIKDVLQTGELSTADALRLRGRMQFTSGQVFGRLSRAALSKVTHHAYRSSRARIPNACRGRCLYTTDLFYLVNQGWYLAALETHLVRLHRGQLRSCQ